jgi:ketosteroid isomerase-like protein
MVSIVRTLVAGTARGRCFRDARGRFAGARRAVILRIVEPGALTPSEALTAVFSTWERGDADAMADLFAEDGVLEDPLKAGTITGREQIREQNRPAVAALEDCRITIRHMFEQGDLGYCEGFFAARLVESGGRLDFPFAATIEMRDGRIARLAEFFDTRPLVP